MSEPAAPAAELVDQPEPTPAEQFNAAMHFFALARMQQLAREGVESVDTARNLSCFGVQLEAIVNLLVSKGVFTLAEFQQFAASAAVRIGEQIRTGSAAPHIQVVSKLN